MNKIAKMMFATAMLTVFAACEKEKEKPAASIEGYAMVLDEGSWGSNNASISLIENQSGKIRSD